MHPEYKRDQFTVSADPSKLDVEAIYDFLSHCYWSEGIPRETVERAIENSLCFGLFDGAVQIGFARVISDYATYAYLCDVYVLESVPRKRIRDVDDVVCNEASGFAGTSTVHPPDPRCARLVPEIRVCSSEKSVALYGNSRRRHLQKITEGEVIW